MRLARFEYAGMNTKPPDDMICAITLELMSDPVVASDGHSYERNAIEGVLRGSRFSPLTREPLKDFVIPNHALRSRIEEYDKGMDELMESMAVRLTSAMEEAGAMARADAAAAAAASTVALTEPPEDARIPRQCIKHPLCVRRPDFASGCHRGYCISADRKLLQDDDTEDDVEDDIEDGGGTCQATVVTEDEAETEDEADVDAEIPRPRGRAPMIPRPRGRAPIGKVWDGRKGEWVVAPEEVSEDEIEDYADLMEDDDDADMRPTTGIGGIALHLSPKAKSGYLHVSWCNKAADCC